MNDAVSIELVLSDGHYKKFLYLVTMAIFEDEQAYRTQILKNNNQVPF
jgi:hypothetical protein